MGKGKIIFNLNLIFDYNTIETKNPYRSNTLNVFS